MSSLAVNTPGGGGEGQTVSGSGSTLKPYLRRKKSSLGETKVAVLGMSGVGKSAERRARGNIDTGNNGTGETRARGKQRHMGNINTGGNKWKHSGEQRYEFQDGEIAARGNSGNKKTKRVRGTEPGGGEQRHEGNTDDVAC
ncbi:hypothetical protein ACOMHN_029738 [Nucella lapillus]